jgi:hypothetical protein
MRKKIEKNRDDRYCFRPSQPSHQPVWEVGIYPHWNQLARCTEEFFLPVSV